MDVSLTAAKSSKSNHAHAFSCRIRHNFGYDPINSNFAIHIQRWSTSMDTIGQILGGLGFLGAAVCFIIVIIKMFQKGSTGLAIACLLLSLCCGLGGIVAYIYGWLHNRDWDMRNLMLAWTVCIILWVIGSALAPGYVTDLQQRFPQP
jgi:hypothetical protein